MCKWFSSHWYRYLFSGFEDCYDFREVILRIICRIKGHPRGMIYFNPSGFEPDYRCKDCFEEL